MMAWTLPGMHTSAVADRFQNHAIPLFSKNLCFYRGMQVAVDTVDRLVLTPARERHGDAQRRTAQA